MPRTYYNEEFLMAKFSEYAYFDPSELASTIFGDRKGYTSPETGTVWDFDPANVFKTGGLGSQCYVFTCRSENDIAVVFRGTVPDQWADLKADARLLLGQAVQWPGQTQALVSAALLNPWQAIKAQVIGKLTDLIQSRQPMGSCRVIVTGHSLGAMLATIAGYSLKQELNVLPSPYLKVIQFAGAPIGNQAFANLFGSAFSGPGADIRYTFYRNDHDYIINSLLLATSASGYLGTAYADFRYILKSPPFGGSKVLGHQVVGFVDALAPASFPTLPPDQSPSQLLPTVYPDSQLTSLVLLLACDEPSPLLSSAQRALSLNIGISAGAPGGKKQLGLLPTAVSRTGVANGTQYVFSFPAASLSGLQVADLKHCSISLAPDPQIVDQNPDATRERIFFHGLELIANTVSILADYDMAISLSTVNTSFQFTVPTPHYNIVGGRVRVTKNNSTQPWIEISQWGDRTSNEKQFYSGRCWSQQYGNDSYYYVTLYVSPFGTGTNPTHEAKVIGGRKQATNNTSTAPWVETNIWGERAGQEFTIGSGRAWSDAYPSNESYQYASLFVAPAPTGSLNRGPRVVGWRVQVSNDNSTAPRIETGFTGERTSYEVQVAEGYCWSSQYGNDSYFYATFYVDRPVFQTPDANVEKTVVLRSLKCITPSETSWYDDDKDEIYIKAVGQRFPRTGNMPMAAGDSMFINLQTALTVTSESSENVEVWDADIVSSDDKLYIFHLSATSLWKASDGSVHQLQLCSPGRYTSSAGRLEDCLYQLEIEVR